MPQGARHGFGQNFTANHAEMHWETGFPKGYELPPSEAIIQSAMSRVAALAQVDASWSL
jgi:hypothetical protein